MRGSPQEAGEALFGWSLSAQTKTENVGHDGVVLELEDKVGQRRETPKVFIDESSQNGILGKRRPAGCLGKPPKRREVFEQFLISDSWRKIFGLEKRKVFHEPLEFRDDRRKRRTPRVAKNQGLG
jgi:hypothetical protein